MATPPKKTLRRPLRFTWRFICGSLGIMVGLVLYGRWISLPWAQGMQTSRKVRLHESRLRDRRAENARLRQHLAYLKSPEGIEALARSRGYHRADEQVYLEPTH